MFNKIARGAFLLVLALMVVSWAMSIGKSSPLEPQSEPTTYHIFC